MHLHYRPGKRQGHAAALLASMCMVVPVVFHAATAAAQSKVGRPPNFVIILVDDLGWTDLGCMGSKYYETPNVDRLAREGMLFTNGYAACAVCSPTRAAVQTGRYPARVGVTDWIRARFQGGIIPPSGKNVYDYVATGKRRLLCPRNPLFMELSEITLAEALKPAGYVCCHIGKWHLGQQAQFPERQGYDVNIGGCDLGQPPSYFDPYESKRAYYEIPNLPPRRKGEYLTDREADEAVAFIRTHRDRPFFLNMCHYAVHTPLMGKKQLVEKYGAKPKTNQKNPVYAAMVESVDAAAGKIVAALEQCGIAEQTVVIFTSDNGGLLGPTNNAPLRSGKGFPYEGGIRVPLIVRWPGVVAPGTRCDVPVSSIDFFPTLLELAGVPLPEGRKIDGVSLVPLLTGKGKMPPRSLFWHFPHYRGKLGPYSIVRHGPWKLIRFWDTDTYELYNLDDDLSETRNLAEENPAMVRQLSEELSQWFASVGARLPEPNPQYKPAQ